MFRTGFKTLAVIAALGLFAQDANAFHRHRGWGSSGGSWGSSGGSWGSSGGSWGSSGGYYYGGSSGGRWGGSSGGRWGSSGGYGYYGGSSGGSWGSSGGYYGGSSGGSSGGSGGGYSVPQGAPVNPAAPSAPATPPTPPAPADAAAPASTMYHPTYGPLRNSALLSVKVPADAKVFVNDRATTSTGEDREYISRDLQAGARYSYKVRAEFTRDGKTVSEEKTVQLTAGQNSALNFTGEQQVQTAKEGDTRTTLIIRLPADAKLFLAGKETKATGDVREFTTSKLAPGAQWQTYAIKAVVTRDGHDEVREQNVSLKAGEVREMSINFDAPQVADASAR